MFILECIYAIAKEFPSIVDVIVRQIVSILSAM